MANDAPMVLMVQGGYDGHDPEKTTIRFAKLLRQEGLEVEVIDVGLNNGYGLRAAFGDAERLKRYDLIVFNVTMCKLPEAERDALAGDMAKAVAAGTGGAGWHGGFLDARLGLNIDIIAGGSWMRHPGGCIDEYTVNLVKKDHPITQGLSDFKMRHTEQYYMLVDPGNNVLATTTFSGEHDEPGMPSTKGVVMPYVWTKEIPNGGKIFAAAFGHKDSDFEVPEAQEIVIRGLRWAVRDPKYRPAGR